MKRLVPSLAIATLLVLVFGCSVGIADPITQNSTLTGPLGNVELHAEATKVGDVWNYIYTISSISGLPKDITGFSIGNSYRASYSSPYHNKNFTNPPVPNSTGSIIWHSGSVPKTGVPITFGFSSIHAPRRDVDVTLYGGALPSGGLSLGLAPEMGSLAALSMLGVGFIAILKKKVRR